MLDRNQRFVVTRKVVNQGAIQRFGKTRIRNGDRDTARGQIIGSSQTFRQMRPERQDRNIIAFAHNAPFADLDRFRRGVQRSPRPFATWIAECDGTVVILGRGHDHTRQLSFVRGSHHRHVGKRRKIPDIERTRMGRTIRAHQTGPVDGKAHRQFLQRNVMHHLVITALQERRINRAEWAQTRRSHPGGECHAMLLGDADIEHTGWKAALHFVQPGARWHCGCHRHNL